MPQNQFEKAKNELPVHVAAPLNRLVNAQKYFNKLHLISNVLSGCLRLYGHTIINIARSELEINETLEQSVESLVTKDVLGTWYETTGKLIKEIDVQKPSLLTPELTELARFFGVSLSTAKTTIERMTILYTIIDGRGQKKEIEVTNTPLNLLIFFRNKYVGHGTVYSEIESKRIYEIFQPILTAFLDSLLKFNTLQFKDAMSGLSINGYDKSCSGTILLHFNSVSYSISSENQLSMEAFQNEIASHVSPSLSLDEIDRKIIEKYPYFLAHPYKRALHEEDHFKRLHLLKEVFLNYLKYLGLLTVSEYFNSNLKIGEINRAFIKYLYTPGLGKWNAFVREAIEPLNHAHQWFVKELPGYYNEIESIPYMESRSTAIGKLIDFRNDYLGHGLVPSESKCLSLWNENLNLLKQLLDKLDFCRYYSIISVDNACAWRLMGNDITQVNLRINKKNKINPGDVVLVNSANESLKLVPFYLMPGTAFTVDFRERAKLMIYDQTTGKGGRIVFFSPESVHGETSNEQVLEQLNLKIREKQRQEPVFIKDMNEASWKAILNENNEDTIQTLLSEKKVIKGVYQKRRDAEVALRTWVDSSAGLFLLVSEAGGGKTNLLLEMNRQYTKNGLDTILLRGNRFRTPDIWEEMCYRLNLTAESSIVDAGFVMYDQKNPLMILIDGANETSDPKALFESIIQFLHKHKGGHIKIILSWRVSTKSELPKAEEKYVSIVYGGANVGNLEQLSDADDGNQDVNFIARSCYWLKPLNKIEVEGAWNKYVSDNQNNVRRKPNFSYKDLTEYDRSLSNQLDNPFLLRLFLELYNGKGLPKNRRGFISIWSLYHEKLIS